MRPALRLFVSLSLAATFLVTGFPVARGARVPDTVVRSVVVSPRTLLPRTAGSSVSLLAGSELRSLSRAPTAMPRVCAPIWFTAVAVTWQQTAGGEAAPRVAVSRDGSTFGRAHVVESDDVPDPGSAESHPGQQASSLLWTGGGRCARVSFDLPARAAIAGVRVVFINSSGTADGPASGPKNVGPVATGPSPGVAQAEIAEPHFITRDQWGADPRLMNCTPDMAPAVKMGFVHHTAGTNSYPRDQADDIVRAIYAFHTNGRGWCDIAYTFLIDRFGDVFQGRSGDPTQPVVSAATQGFNTGSFSVSMMGNFSTAAPPPVAMRALKRVLAWRLDVAHVNPSSHVSMTSYGGDHTRYRAGTIVQLNAISGHRDTGLTSCPGGALYARLPEIRAAVAAMGLPKFYSPRLSHAEIAVGAGDTIRIRARGSTTLEWSVDVYAPDGTLFVSLPTPPVGQGLDVVWVGLDATPMPRVAGTYQVVIGAQTPKGTIARPASLLLLVNPIPLG